MSVVDVSGYSFSGKSAVYDLLSSCPSFYGFGVNFEFELLRAPGGIIELREALTGESWSPVRSSDAVRRFLKLISNLGGRRTLFDRLTKLGNHYDHHFPNFTQISIQYLDELIIGDWAAFWPFSKFQYNLLEVVSYKVFSRLGIGVDDHVYLSRLEPSVFDAYTKAYLAMLFPPEGNKLGQSLVINNAFEPFNPSNSTRLISGAKSIIVDRDPRDIYLAALASSQGAGSQVGAAVVGNNVKDFVNRFRVYRSAVNTDSNSNVYRMTFESLIQDFDETVSELTEFLDVDIAKPHNQGIGLDVERSSKNIGMWRRLSDVSDFKAIAYIESELSDYCMD
jgi:hypothetical protein